MREHIVARPLAADFLEGDARLLQIGEHEFFRQRPAVGKGRVSRSRQGVVRALDERDVPHVSDGRPISE